MEYVLPVYKMIGETPLGVIERIRQSFPEYVDTPMTYAGRLDPMAEGLLLLLAGDECHHKENYMSLDKTYYVQIILGIGTDTGDGLGMVDTDQTSWQVKDNDIQQVVQGFQGTFLQEYPSYSSKTFQGKPLFSYARQGIDVPSQHHEITIHDIAVTHIQHIPLQNIVDSLFQSIDKIQGDFRQGQIKQSWQSLLVDIPGTTMYTVVDICVTASRGAYMRQLAKDIGKKLGIPACAGHIYRARIGDFSLKNKAPRILDK